MQVQGRRTRAALLDAGLIALGEHGYHAARVDDVVHLAGLSHGTFYLYFGNKEALFGAMAERCATETEELAAALPEIVAGAEGRAVLRVWLAEFVALYAAHGAVIRAWAEQHVADQQLKDLGRAAFGHITRSIAARLPADADDRAATTLRAVALLGMIERFSYVWTSRDLGRSEDVMLDTLAGVIHRGFFS